MVLSTAPLVLRLPWGRPPFLPFHVFTLISREEVTAGAVGSSLEAAYLLGCRGILPQVSQAHKPAYLKQLSRPREEQVANQALVSKLGTGSSREGLVFKGSDQEMAPLGLRITHKIESFMEGALFIHDALIVGWLEHKCRQTVFLTCSLCS